MNGVNQSPSIKHTDTTVTVEQYFDSDSDQEPVVPGDIAGSAGLLRARVNVTKEELTSKAFFTYRP